MIHVSYCFHDADGRYSKFCGTSILSMFENTSERVTVHILHDNTLTGDNRDKFIYLAGQYRQHIKFYDVDQCASHRMNYFRQTMSQRFSHLHFIGTFYRLLLPEIISPSIDKIIYLDAGDTIVNLDIKQIWDVELGDHPLAAVDEIDRITGEPMKRSMCDDGLVQYGKYFNAGVLVINLDRWRANLNKIFGDRHGGGGRRL